MIKKVNRAFADRWLIKAERDLVMAGRALTRPNVLTDMACFHAQQAVEKALKGALTLHGIAFEKTHTLSPLLDSLKKPAPELKLASPALAAFSSYGVMVRYPGWLDDPSEEDSRKALDVAADVVRQVRKHMGEAVCAESKGSSAERKGKRR